MRDEMSLLPNCYHKDLWLSALFSGASAAHKRVNADIQQLPNNIFFDSMTESQVTIEEELCRIACKPGFDLMTRRAILEAQWKAFGKGSREQLQHICDSWKNGEVRVEFTDDSVINLVFTGEIGIPDKLETLLNAVEAAKPAHLPMCYQLRYLMLSEVHGMSIDAIEKTCFDKFAGGV